MAMNFLLSQKPGLFGANVQPALDPGPAAPAAPAGPGPLVGAFRGRVDSALKPHQAYAMDYVSSNLGRHAETEDLMTRAWNGESLADIQKSRDQEDATHAATKIAIETGHLDDSAFETYLSHLNDLATHPPAPAAPVPLKGPSTLQLLAGGLGALLVPQFAATAIAAPFAESGRRQAQETQDAQIAADGARKAWQGQIDGTETALNALQRQEANRLTLANQKAIADANNQARLAGAQTAAAARVKSTMLTVAGKAAIAAQVSADKGLAQAVRVAVASGPDARSAMYDNLRDLAPGVFGRLDDDAIEAVAHLLPKETQALAGANASNASAAASTANAGLARERTSDLKATRQYRVQNLIKSGKLTDARAEAARANADLDEIRKQYLPQEFRAKIAQIDARADKARKEANDMYAGIHGRGRAGVDAWTKMGMRLQDAEDRTQAQLDGVRAQRAAISEHGRILRQQYETSDETRKAQIVKEMARLSDAMDKLSAVEAEKASYLERVKGQKADAQAQIEKAANEAPPAAMPGKGPAGKIGKGIGVGQTRTFDGGITVKRVK